jgi:glycosyltransferase 2 family protein
MPSSPRRLLRVAVGLIVSGGLLVYLFHDVDFAEMGRRLASTRWSFLAASVVIYLAALWSRARRWYYLYPPEAHPTHLLRALVIGYMGNNLLPLRAGEILRTYVMVRHGQQLWTTVGTVVVERVLDGLAVGCILAYLLVTVALPRELWWGAAAFLAVVAAGMAVLAVMAWAPELCRRILLGIVCRVAPSLTGRFSDILDTFNEGLRGARTRSHVAPMLVWSAAGWVLWALSAWMGLHAAHLDLPLTASWAVLGLLGLGVSLPSSPGFAGIVQAATVLALALFGVPRQEALSFSLLLHAAQFIPVTLWGLSLVVFEQVSLSDVARAGAPQPASGAAAGPIAPKA